MRNRIVVRDLDRNLVGELLVEPLEELLVSLVSRAQGHNDHLFAGQAIGDLGNQIETFLSGKARHDANHGKFWIGVLDPEGCQQILLVFGFS